MLCVIVRHDLPDNPRESFYEWSGVCAGDEEELALSVCDTQSPFGYCCIYPAWSDTRLSGVLPDYYASTRDSQQNEVTADELLDEDMCCKETGANL